MRLPIRIKQSWLFGLMMFVAALFLPVISILATSRAIRDMGMADFIDLRILPLIHGPATLTTTVALLAALCLIEVWLFSQCSFWSVTLVNDLISYRSLYGRKSMRVIDVRCICCTGGRGTYYKIIDLDENAIVMREPSFSSFLDLARLEDYTLRHAPQVNIKCRMFTKIMKHGYTEYL